MEEKPTTPDDVQGRIVKLENDLKAQEHRISVIVKNIIDYGFDNSDEKRRNAVWISLIGYLLSRQTATIIVGGLSMIAACIGIWMAWQANGLVKEQNKLIERQNFRLDQQTYLQESERRSSLVFLIGDVLESIDKELKDDVGEKKLRDLTPELVGRIVALTHILRPYMFMDGDTLIGNELSPEKGQLLISLLGSNIDSSSLFAIFDKADFSNSFLRNAKFEDVAINHITLNASDFRNAKFFNCEISNSMIMGSDFSKTYLDSCTFLGVGLWQGIFHQTQFTNCKFQKSPFNHSYFIESYFYECHFYDCDFYKSKIYGTHFSKGELIKVAFVHDTILRSSLEVETFKEVTISNKTLIDDISFPNRYKLERHEIIGRDTIFQFIPEEKQ